MSDATVQVYRSGSTRSVFIPERLLGSLRAYCKSVAVVPAQVDLRILISIPFWGRGLP